MNNEERCGLVLDAEWQSGMMMAVFAVDYNIKTDIALSYADFWGKFNVIPYDFLILEPAVIIGERTYRMTEVGPIFRQELLNEVMARFHRPIIICTSWPEAFQDRETLPDNIAVICKPTSASEIVPKLEELFIQTI